MADEIEFDLDENAISDLDDSVAAAAMLQDVGDQIADSARDNADKRTGAGAASIRAEVSSDGDGLHVDVSWDDDHYYMRYLETGTSRQTARPFLRPALDSTRI